MENGLSSLEGLVFPLPQPLSADEHSTAAGVFDQTITHFEPSQANENDYKPITLLRLMKGSVRDVSGFF